jgi:hypothetical protein
VSPTKTAQPEIPLRIIVDAPLPGVAIALQQGKDGIVPPTHSSVDSLVFDFTVRLGAVRGDGVPNFVGPFAQGPAGERFVYLAVGQRAGQLNSIWNRRIKVPLGGISQALVDTVLMDARKRLVVHVPGRARDGSPTAASVRLAADAWTVADDS